jgi:hypothetical protein
MFLEALRFKNPEIIIIVPLIRSLVILLMNDHRKSKMDIVVSKFKRNKKKFKTLKII